MRPIALAGILVSTTLLGGCAATIGGLSLSSISSFAGFASTLFTGADLGEHMASLVTGKNCRFSEGLMREDRDVCEEPGSPATRNDFHGIFVERIDADGTVIYAAPKYMPASAGAGENENNPDVIWAEIKTQKAKEEGERQLARAQAAQTIDVAALATGSLSPQSLAFLPANTNAQSDAADAESASQTAKRPRAVANAAQPAMPRHDVQAAADVSFDTNQPAIDEKAFIAPAQAAPVNATGEGGPFYATATSSAPVVSTLINGEPVVVLRLRPIFTAASTPASAEPADEVAESGAVQPAPAAVPSPLAVLTQPPARAALPTRFASIEPQMTMVRPRTKPTAAELAAKAKPARVRRADLLDAYKPISPSDDVYQPADTTAPVPGDISSEYPPSDVTPPPATSGPAPLVRMPQE